MRIDLHNHTCYSYDASNTIEDLNTAYLNDLFDVLAITDHNTIEGAADFKPKALFPIIVGQEINTLDGEVIGLYLTLPIPQGLSVRETIPLIKAQGGLVYVPHPFLPIGGHPITRSALHWLLPWIDILESYNALIPFPRANVKADQFAQHYGLICGAGSDAHIPVELGHGFVDAPGDPEEVANRPQALISSLAVGQVGGQHRPLHEKAAHKLAFHGRQYWNRVNGHISSK